ncbi:uncharacterized protein TM35_000031310 [Trypanosoma theileri]|uniref:Uncharacterized protein n=1 Tax=Trypanosoma theileri TaxID=67003 RepID=A0A1X0P697_9TRYP|nr:uncharacterized protein TM35_000031310 [Trypanosoma theileri]ORC92378.1 hypothetical protein TM35_000031310 [Trypanosoma theileri]
MFGRRVFASAGVPRHAWAALHIQSSRQASRILPSLAPLAPLECRRQLSGAVAAVSAWQTTPAVSDALLSEDGLLMLGINSILPLSPTMFIQPHGFISPCTFEKVFRVACPTFDWAAGEAGGAAQG